MCSILTTKNHDMFTRVAIVNKSYTKLHAAGSNEEYVHDDFCKAKAGICINVDLLHFQAYAEGGGALPSSPETSPILHAHLVMLGIKNEAQKHAFFLFYGFWLRKGSLQCMIDGQCAVTIKQVENADWWWLEGVLCECQVAYSSSCVGEETDTKCVRILDVSWSRVFAMEYISNIEQERSGRQNFVAFCV